MMNEQELLSAIGKMLDERLKPIEERTQRIEERTQRIEERTQRLEVLLENDIPRDIHLIAEQHTDIIEKLDAISDYGDTKGRVSTLENVVQSHTDDLKELQKRIG